MRKFGAILSTLPRSERWRRLQSDNARVTYLLLQSSQFGNSAGCFVMPPELFAADNQRDPSDVSDAFDELEQVNLIRQDRAEKIIQLVGFYKANAVSSRKHLAGPLRILTEQLPRSAVVDAACCELAAHLVEKSLGWSPDHDARGAFLQTARDLIERFDLSTLMVSDTIGLSKALLETLSETLLIPLPIQKTLTKTGTGTPTLTGTPTRTRTLTQAGTPESGDAAKPPPSSPAGGSRPGADTDAMIAELRDKAKKEARNG